MKWIVALISSTLMALPVTAQDRATGPVAIADHLALHVADAEASAAFYKKTFGFIDVPSKLPNTRWLSMGNGMTLHLIGGRIRSVSPDRIVHFALRTKDLSTSIAYFEANGIVWYDFTGKPKTVQTRFDGVRQIFVQDPDGYWVEVSDNPGKAND